MIMEALTALFRAVDSLFMAITIGIGGLFGTFNIDIPLFTAYAPAPTPAITEPITATTDTIQASPAPKTTPKKVVIALPVVTKPTEIPSVPNPLPPTPSIAYEVLNADTRAALVNILCLASGGSGVGSVSGSGITIDPRGIILTNAHIGQFFLLKDYPVQGSIECTVRIGSPAQPRYHAELLYLPPAWVDSNAIQLKAEKAMGTGEHDYAFLRITDTTNPEASLPSSFPAVSVANSDPEIGESVLIAAYPAGFLDGSTIERNLYASSVVTVVQKLFTFDAAGFIDAVSVGGTVVSQGGSSGGAVVRTTDGKVLGIIATATAGATTGDRDLRAVITAHINRSLVAQGKGSIEGLLAKDPATEAANFALHIAPAERQKLIDVLQSKNSN